MKNRTYSILSFFFGWFLLSACNTQPKAEQNPNVYYTCSMDPQVREKKPGKCPICKMELTKVVVSQKERQSQTIQLSASQIQLANIRVDTVGSQRIGKEMVLTGRVVLNQNNTAQISSRVPGRVERLYFRNTGEVIKTGDRLYDLYSEELLKARQEFLLATEKLHTLSGAGIDYAPIVEAARNKLLLWGMSAKQIETLAKSKAVSPTVPIYSQRGGIIQEVSIQEGDYVAEGSLVFRLADLSTVWVEAQWYTTEMPQPDANQEVTVSFPAFPGQTLRGKISFVSPELEPQSKINLARVDIPNPQGRYTPGMQALVRTKGSTREGIAVPVGAVIQEARGSSVWIRNPDGSFENRMVSLGIGDEQRVEILSGLKPGDQIVTSGAYLLNSEYILKKGSTPMEGMEMPGMKM